MEGGDLGFQIGPNILTGHLASGNLEHYVSSLTKTIANCIAILAQTTHAPTRPAGTF